MQRKRLDCHFLGLFISSSKKPQTSYSLYPLRRRGTPGPPTGLQPFSLICYCGFRPREAKLIDALRLRGDLLPSCATSNWVSVAESLKKLTPPFFRKGIEFWLWWEALKNCSPYGRIVVGHFNNKRHVSKIMVQSRKSAWRVYMNVFFGPEFISPSLKRKHLFNWEAESMQYSWAAAVPLLPFWLLLYCFRARLTGKNRGRRYGGGGVRISALW